MWKQYMQPTKSTKAKAKEPENVRDRIQSLSQALCGLKEEIKIENSTTAQNLERLEKQQFGTLHSQVFALKKAFTDLADAMIDEVETVRSEYRGELSDLRQDLYGRLESCAESQKSHSDITNQAQSSLTSSLKQSFQYIQSLKSQQDTLQQEIEHLKSQSASNTHNQQDFIRRVEQLLKENLNQISLITSESTSQKSRVAEIEVMTKQLSYVLEKEKESIKFIEEKVNRDINDFDKRLKYFCKDFEDISNRKEFVEFRNSVLDIEYKNEELLREFKKEIFQNTIEVERKIEQFSKSQDGFNEFICNEIKSIENYAGLGKRIEYLEDLSTTQRREIFNSLTSMEQNIYKKQEKITKAIYQLARNQEMPEALLMI